MLEYLSLRMRLLGKLRFSKTKVFLISLYRMRSSKMKNNSFLTSFSKTKRRNFFLTLYHNLLHFFCHHLLSVINYLDQRSLSSYRSYLRHFYLKVKRSSIKELVFGKLREISVLKKIMRKKKFRKCRKLVL